MKPKRHVIFLGAGASITSGYADANRLTVLMCDRGTFYEELANRLAAEGETNATGWIQNSTVRSYYDSFSQTVQLLRAGDFATMDELSNLALGGQRSSEISRLKKLMRFVFALNNPEETHWPKSDYRAFISALFERRCQLREDVSVISFNYDPYFEYRLLRALRAREQIRPIAPQDSKRMSQAVTSGFLFPTDVEWIQTPGFCHLKLHGTCVLPAPQGINRPGWPPQQDDPVDLTTEHMFGLGTLPRFLCLSDHRFASQDPPALLPWEIVSNDGKLREQADFESTVGRDWQHRSLYPLFRGLWQRARRDVQEADKISFIGLSIGPFMEPGLRFLFDGKRDIVKSVVANPDNIKYKDFVKQFHPRTCCGKVLDALYKVSPRMVCTRSDSEDGLVVSPDSANHSDEVRFVTTREAGEMTARTDFADFIQHEL